MDVSKLWKPEGFTCFVINVGLWTGAAVVKFFLSCVFMMVLVLILVGMMLGLDAVINLML